ncbi:unnamed protein product [Cylicocyclus nassatus]|uniref:Uncharacterized protein n=1 Tax=Cylicocyclus nassatus TaxID=53992 RepID=A0AA36M8X3_CYLNA|nr:unnamed protein product [Cylicocyclus nassatus]
MSAFAFVLWCREKNCDYPQFYQREIQIAKYDRLARSFESQPRKAKDTHGQTRVLSLNNLTRPWKLDEAAPFKGVENPELLVRFSFNDTEPCYQNFARVFRFIIQQLTEPPQQIQNYAIRYHRKAGREKHLQNLPVAVEVTLQDFALDLFGLGDPQLRLGKRAANERTRFYIELGENEKDRQKKLDELLADFDLYKSEILKGMQLALRDIRSYEYDMEKNSGCHTRLFPEKKKKAPETNPVMELRELQNQNQAYLALSLE